MPPTTNKAQRVFSTRITEQDLVTQTLGYRTQDTFVDAKARLAKTKALYRGDLASQFPDETGLPVEPLVENKLKNALHDTADLASEARGMPFFPARGDSVDDAKKARIREAIASTLWDVTGARKQERKYFMDILGAGFVAAAVYFNEKSEYPQVLRLNPEFCYPTVHNGYLVDMLYVETMKARIASKIFKNLPDVPADSDENCLLISYYDDEETVQAVSFQKNGKPTVAGTHFVDHWKHMLGCVPVAYVKLDTFDDATRGRYEQLGGPMMIRNKAVRLVGDYLEDMVYAPWEHKNMIEPLEEPGPKVRYEHDPNSDESFIRRVPPAAPAGAVFGLIQLLADEESLESTQPPARVGNVQQAIASGNFVNSTQGTLSSLIVELQDLMAEFRYQLNYIMFKVDQKHLDIFKPLVISVGNKKTYKPSTDMGEELFHRIVYGATSGLRPIDADVRVLQHLGAKLISKETARAQIDYIADETSEQMKIDREGLAEIIFQRFASDPSPDAMAITAQALLEMSEGKSLVEAIKAVAPQIIEYKQRQAAAPGAPAGELPAAPPGTPPAEEAAALQAGGIPEQAPLEQFEPEFASAPIQQQIVRNPL